MIDDDVTGSSTTENPSYKKEQLFIERTMTS